MTPKPDEMHDDETGTFQHSKPDHLGQQDDDLSGEVTELRPAPDAQPRERSEEAPEPAATVGDTVLTPDPGATMDSVCESFDAETVVTPESAGGDLDATIVPSADASMTIISALGASLEDDVEPGHTIKAPASAAARRGSAFQPTITLKRRNVSQQESGDSTSDATVNVDADYQIEELLGEGGMGAVYAARQKSMDRPVAIKVLKSRAARLESGQDAFVSEAIITGRLDHPNIVPIYDVGKQPNDALFYAIKQVEGVEWKERFATNTASENLDILLRVADAIAFAHARGIIHRDLKPANIMLGPFGEVLVMDWGLAMPTEDHPSRETFPEARAGGTPHYMAPEMADGTERVDRRSDVYLMGAMLFEIVTGKPPHALDLPEGPRRERVLAVLDAVANNVIAPTDKTGELLDIARKAIATEPADRYQTVPEFQAALREYLSHEESIELADRAAARLAAGRQSGEYTEFSRARFGFETALEEWPQNVRAAEGLQATRFDYSRTAFDRGDLDLALSLIDESDSKQNELGTSIRQAIVDRDARQQQLRRLRRISLAASLTVAVVAIGAAVWINSERSKALVAQQEEAAQRELAERSEQEALQQRQVAESERSKAEDERQRAIIAQMAAEESEQKATAAEAEAIREANNARRNLRIAEQNGYYSDMLLLNQSWAEANSGQFKSLLDQYRDREDLRGFEWAYWERLAQTELLSLAATRAYSRGVEFSSDGNLLAFVGPDRTVKILDMATGQELLSLTGHTSSIVNLSFNPDGKRLASASDDKTIKVWDIVKGKEVFTLKGHSAQVRDVSYSPDGAQFASASGDETIKIWDAVTGENTRTLTGHRGTVHCAAFSPDGTRLASSGEDNTLRVWDISTGQETLNLKYGDGAHNAVSFSPDGALLAATFNNEILILDSVTGQEIRRMSGHSSNIFDVSFGSDGKRLASASFDRTVKVWDSATGQQTLTIKGHKGPVVGTSFSPDGTRLATASTDGTVKVWAAVDSPDALVLNARRLVSRCASFSPDGKLLAVSDWNDSVRVWDTAAGQNISTVGNVGHVRCLSFSPDGRLLACGGDDNLVTIRDAATLKVKLQLKAHTSPVTGVSYSPDGTKLVSASRDKTLKLWDATTGQELRTLSGHAADVIDVAFSADGTRLASASIDKTVRVWDANTGKESLKFTGHTGYVFTVSFGPEGTQLASADNEGRMILWDVISGEIHQIFTGHNNRIESAAFSPDRRRLASASDDGTAKVWDVTTGKETLTLKVINERVKDISFSPDGTRLVTVDTSKETGVKIWDTRPWTPILRNQAQARSYLKIMRDRLQSLEELQTYIRDDKTISEEVRQQCLDWAELFWKNRSSPE